MSFKGHIFPTLFYRISDFLEFLGGVFIALYCEKPFIYLCPGWSQLVPSFISNLSSSGLWAQREQVLGFVSQAHPCMNPMSTRTASEKTFLFRDTFCFSRRPQYLTLLTDVVHPEEVAGRCHLLSFGVTGEKQKLCEGQDLHYVPCLCTSPWTVPLTPSMCTRRTEMLHVRAVGGWSSGLVGNDCWGFEPETGGTGSTGHSDHHQAAFHPSTAPASTWAWPGYHGKAAGKEDGMWEMQNWNQGKVTAIKTEVSNAGQAVSTDPPICLLSTLKGWRPGLRACLGNQQLLHCSPRKLLTCMFVGNCTSYFWPWDPV